MEPNLIPKQVIEAFRYSDLMSAETSGRASGSESSRSGGTHSEQQDVMFPTKAIHTSN